MKKKALLVLVIAIGCTSGLGTFAVAEDFSSKEVVVDLKIEQESLSEVLLQLEKKTGYKIQLDRELYCMDCSVTVEFIGTSLQESIERLLVGVNYSLIFDDVGKEIRILTFGKAVASSDKMHGSGSRNPGQKLNSSGVSSMAASSSAIKAYKRNLNSGVQAGFEPDKTPMSVATLATQNYREGGSVTPPDYVPDVSPMSASTSAIMDRQKMLQGDIEVERKLGKSPMSVSTSALEEYRERKKSHGGFSIQPEYSPMTASGVALEEYHKLK